MIALLEARRAGLLERRHWLPNVVSGVIVGVVALPLAMAFAIASGARPEQGLYTAIVAGLFVSALGGSRVQIAGPTGAFIVILLVTLFLTVFADLVVAVNIGVVLATLQFLRRMASSVEVREATEQEIRQEFSHLGITRLPPGVLAYAVEGPFFFGAVDAFERALAQARADPKVLIIRLRWVPFIDITGLQALEEAIGDLRRRGVRVMICGANPRVHGKLERAGLVALVGEGGYFPDFGAALEACRRLAEADPAIARGRAALISETAQTPARGGPSA